MLPRCTLVLLLCLTFTSGLRADDWPVARGPSREPFPYQYDPHIPIPKNYLEETPACVLYTATTYLLQEDGSVEAITHEVTRLNSRKGVERLGEYRSIYYDPSYQKLTLHEARVHRPGGKAAAVEPRHVHLRDVGTDFQVYYRDKQLVISFPDLEIGDIIEVKWSTSGKNPEYFGQFFTRYSFGDDRFPTLREELRVRAPKSKKLNFVSHNGRVPATVRDEGKALLYQWVVHNRAERPQDDSSPPRETTRLQVACSTFASWAEIEQWKAKLRANCWECTPEIQNIVRQTTAGLTDPVAKARALTYWVRKHIRYVSVSASGAGYTPQTPARVLANLFGDCKDQSQLLAVMLREAGIRVELATLGLFDDGQVLPEVPMPWGTHAILMATIDGRRYWIDTTVSNAPWDFLPRDDRDRVCYVTHGDGVRLLRTPGLNSHDHRYEQTTWVTVRADGTGACKRQAIYHGGGALVYRDSWHEAAPGERRRLMAAELQDANSKTRLRWLQVDEASLLDFDGPVRAEMEYEIPGHFSGTGDKEGSVSDSRIWSRLLSYTLDHDRKLALDLGSPVESFHKFIVELPPAYRFDGLPREHKVHSKWGSFRVLVKHNPAEPRRLEITHHLRLERTLVEPADFAAFRQFHDDVYKVWRTWLSLTPTRDAADILALAARLIVAPDDSISALVLAQLLRDEGQGEGELVRQVLRLARLHQPNDAAVWEMTVALAATLEEQERALRQMVQRFPQQPKYVLRLGAVRVKLGDHAGARAVLAPLALKSGDAIQPQAALELARSDLAQNKPSDALERLLTAGIDASRSVQAALLHGEILGRLREPEKAADAYRRALKQEADNETALAALIRLEIAADNHPDALDYLRRYALLVGDDLGGLVQAGTWYMQLGRLDDALELALRARELKFNSRTQRLLGLIHAKLGNHAKSVHHLTRADVDAEVVLHLVRGYVALGNLHAAIEWSPWFDRFKIVPAGWETTAGLLRELAERRAWYLRDPRVPARQKAEWSEAIDAFLCAELAYRDGLPAAEVEALLALALAQPIECAPAVALRGLLELERGRLTRALADAENALRLDPWDARAYYVRGRIRWERGDKQALSDLSRAALLSRRGDGWVLHWLAAAEFDAGLHEQALATQSEAALLRPREPEIVEQLQAFEKAVRGQ